jgi:acetolactate synthase small subunit
VTEQVEGQVDDPGSEPGRVDLTALDGAVDDLLAVLRRAGTMQACRSRPGR